MIQLMLKNIVNIANVCLQPVKPDITYLTFQSVALTVTVLDIHQRSEMIPKRNLFHLEDPPSGYEHSAVTHSST